MHFALGCSHKGGNATNGKPYDTTLARPCTMYAPLRSDEGGRAVGTGSVLGTDWACESSFVLSPPLQSFFFFAFFTHTSLTFTHITENFGQWGSRSYRRVNTFYWTRIP
jgi:hypothetical protein